MEQLNKLLGNSFADDFHDYGDYSVSLWRFHHRQRLFIIEKYITKYSNGKTALDAGAGKGPVTYLLSKSFAKVHSFEFSDDEIKRLKLNLNSVAIKSAEIGVQKVDLTQIPLKNNSVDLIVCTEVLEHIPNEEMVSRELYRVLKNNSYMIFSMPNKNSPYWVILRIVDYIRRFILKRDLSEGYGYWELSRHWGFSTKQIKDILLKEGFKVVKTEGVGFASFSSRILKYFYKGNNLKILLSFDILLSKTLKKLSPYYFVIVEK